MQNNFNNRTLDLIRSKISLVEIIGKDTNLKKKGKEFVGHCPFHSEKTGSFFVNDEKGKYYCFGCGAHGDIFSYLIQSKGFSFKQTLEYLANLTGVKLPKFEITPEDNKFFKKTETYLNMFKENLKKSKSALEYCKNRNIDKDLIESFSIGFCPEFGIPREIAKFKGRLMFPIYSSEKNVIGFGGRIIAAATNPADNQPKYINSNESEFFQKKEILYGYQIASKNITKDKQFIVVEGYMDVIMMHKFGFDTTVGSMGTSFTSDQLLRLWRYSNEPILCFDGDEAGKKAMVRAGILALEYLSPGKTLRFCTLPHNQDPDTFLNENSHTAMENLISNSKYLIDFLWNYFETKYYKLPNKTPEHISKWKKECLDQLKIITNEEIKKLYVSNIREHIYTLLQPKSKKTKYLFLDASNNIDKKNKKILREAILLYTPLKRRSIIPYIFEKMALISFSSPTFNLIANQILTGEEEKIPIKEFKNIEFLTKNYYKIEDNVPDEEVINFWNEIFDSHVLHKGLENDVKSAKSECINNFNQNTWERLKALKLSLLNNRKNNYDKQ